MTNEVKNNVEVEQVTSEQNNETATTTKTSKESEVEQVKPSVEEKATVTESTVKSETVKKVKPKAIKRDTSKDSKETTKYSALETLDVKTFVSSSANTPISTLMYNVRRGKYDMCHSVQRKANQWSQQTKEKFLQSCLMNIVPQEIIICAVDKSHFVVDGKQRLSCLDEYINKKDTGLTVFGKKFNELDEDTREKLKSRQINVVTYANCTDADIFMLFERYNSGVALSSAQKSRSYCSIAMLNRVKELLNKPFISEKCNLTNGQTLKDEDTICIFQSCMIISDFNFKSFNGKEVDRYLQEVDEKEIMKALDTVDRHIDILDKLVTEKNKNLKKIHLPMILACASDSDFFKGKMNMFITHYEGLTELRRYCMGSTSKKENVMGRIKFWSKA